MAAVIHPTGTGKSMIAFKLVEQHPHNHFLWLSPSEYIYKTQLENIDTQFSNIADKYKTVKDEITMLQLKLEKAKNRMAHIIEEGGANNA